MQRDCSREFRRPVSLVDAPGRAEVEAAAVERCQYEAREPCHLVVVQCNR
jgi:hypothetical protein